MPPLCYKCFVSHNRTKAAGAPQRKQYHCNRKAYPTSESVPPHSGRVPDGSIFSHSPDSAKASLTLYESRKAPVPILVLPLCFPGYTNQTAVSLHTNSHGPDPSAPQSHKESQHIKQRFR